MNTNENKQIIPIFFASDDNYVPYLYVSIKSIVETSSKNNNYAIYILNSGLKKENVSSIKELETSNIKIDFVDVTNKIKNIKSRLNEQLRDYYSESIFYRLFIPSLFPQYKKAIYLDCDITVVKDIAELYNTNLKKMFLGAIVDEVVTSNEIFCDYVEKALGVNKNQYFNSGILLMNLDEFIKNDVEGKFLNLLQKYNIGTVAPDQDYLNILCKNKVLYLDKCWNKMPVENTNYNPQNIKLVHYNMFQKPWKYSNVLYENFFWNIAKQTKYYNQLLTFRENYSSDKKQKDFDKASQLLEYCQQITYSPNNFKNQIEKNLKQKYKINCNILDRNVIFDLNLDNNNSYVY